MTFAGAMSEPGNRAALAFRSAVDEQNWPEVTETSTSLVSTFLEVDLASVPLAALTERIENLLEKQDWLAAPLPAGRKLWHVPTLYGTELAPQLEEAAEVAGIDPAAAVQEISTSRVRVLTIGFAPGQPYMGELSETWNIPRQQGLTKSVPPGALVIAIRQLIVFTNAAPTGWRHIGQTAFGTFLPDSDQPFTLSPGDELIFPSVSPAEFERIRSTDTSGLGGASREVLK
ncbi:Allophanate hydrolase family protein [Sulfitobacter noctilucicola]|nr:Allophanate hydrolase family protein [Sulfitobacter noctilucicola]